MFFKYQYNTCVGTVYYDRCHALTYTLIQYENYGKEYNIYLTYTAPLRTTDSNK